MSADLLKCGDCAKFCDRWTVHPTKSKITKDGLLGLIGNEIIISVPDGDLVMGMRECSMDGTSEFIGTAKDTCLVPPEFIKQEAS